MISENMVSVIVAVYNAEKYLRECLDSIVGQSYKNLEIICVNDGSSDHSEDILKEYASRDKRITILCKENEGLGGASARNMGLSQASGEYVSILDSDDFFDTAMYEKAVEKSDTLGTDILIFGGFEYDDRSGKKRKINGILNESLIPEKQVFSYKDCPERIFQISQGMAWNKLYRRSFLERTGLRFQRIKFTDDAYFTFTNMVLAERVAILNEPFCNYRINTGSSQTEGMASCPDSAYLPYLRLKETLEEKGIFDEVRVSFINLASEFARFFYDNTGTYESFKYLHDKLKNEVFDKLGIPGLPPEVFRDKRCAEWIDGIIKYSAEEILFLSARSHGCPDSTTGILRFQFPYELIPANSRIVIIGDRIAGRHYISQAVLSGLYDVVLWVDKDNPRRFESIHGYDELENTDFDYALITYTDRGRTDEAVSVLRKSGVQDGRIIICD